jgi:hypothetical protein
MLSKMANNIGIAFSNLACLHDNHDSIRTIRLLKFYKTCINKTVYYKNNNSSFNQL